MESQKRFHFQTAGLFLSILHNMRTCLSSSGRLHGSIAQSPKSPTIAFLSSFLQFLQTLRKVSPLGMDACLRALWPIMGREVVCISQRNHSRYVSDSQFLILCPYKFMKEHRPGPLVRPAIDVYSDIQFQKEIVSMSCKDCNLGIWNRSADIHSSLSGSPNKPPPNTSAIYCLTLANQQNSFRFAS